MSAHSPGPWVWKHSWSGVPEVLVDASGFTVAHTYTAVSDWNTSPADRALMAAAPALLASLKAMLAQVHADCLREGEEAAVEAAETLVASLDG